MLEAHDVVTEQLELATKFGHPDKEKKVMATQISTSRIMDD